MIRTIKDVVVSLLILTIPVTTWSKGEIIKIEIEGNNLSSPIEITDPDIVRQFSIWTGPGVSTRGPDGVPNPPAYLDPNLSAGRFIDWPKGTVAERPTGLQRYDVTFYIGSREPVTKVQGTYVITYEIDPSTEHGYVYLPTGSKQTWNTTFIYHGVEGNWFHSSNKWEALVRPLIEKTIEADDSRTDYLYLTAPDDDAQHTSAVNPSAISVQVYFNEKLREGVIDRIGQPIEGFVPFMFMQAFSGLVPNDFDGADALLGEYKIMEKELAFIVDEGGPIHSAAEAISEEGMKTVFSNIQRRTNVLITTTDEVNGLLLSLGAPLALAVTECLPEQRDVDACIEIYQPVCASVNVQCVTTPCDPVQETFANSCKACKNSLVSTYTKGECPVAQ